MPVKFLQPVPGVLAEAGSYRPGTFAKGGREQDAKAGEVGLMVGHWAVWVRPSGWAVERGGWVLAQVVLAGRLLLFGAAGLPWLCDAVHCARGVAVPLAGVDERQCTSTLLPTGHCTGRCARLTSD